MPNPFNPLDWIKSAQDWFVRAEKSSGFRPYLIFLLLSFGTGLLLVSVTERPLLELAGFLLMTIPALAFIPLYAWKAHTDPEFCRSETHVQRLKKYQLEMMGSNEKQIEGEVLEELQISAQKEPVALPGQSKTPSGGGDE